jgi:hypothetical protein
MNSPENSVYDGGDPPGTTRAPTVRGLSAKVRTADQARTE